MREQGGIYGWRIRIANAARRFLGGAINKTTACACDIPLDASLRFYYSDLTSVPVSTDARCARDDRAGRAFSRRLARSFERGSSSDDGISGLTQIAFSQRCLDYLSIRAECALRLTDVSVGGRYGGKSGGKKESGRRGESAFFLRFSPLFQSPLSRGRNGVRPSVVGWLLFLPLIRADWSARPCHAAFPSARLVKFRQFLREPPRAGKPFAKVSLESIRVALRLLTTTKALPVDRSKLPLRDLNP